MTFIGVCGGRDYSDRARVRQILSDELRVYTEPVVVHGNAHGADKMAAYVAGDMGWHTVAIPALWDTYGRSAGHRRNAVIAALPLAKLIAFPGGAGTADMVRRARAAGIPVVEVAP